MNGWAVEVEVTPGCWVARGWFITLDAAERGQRWWSLRHAARVVAEVVQ